LAIISKKDKKIEQGVQYKKTILSNGLTVLTEQVDTVESFALGYFIGVGSRDENDFPEGTAHFMEHAAFKNSGKRNSRQIANRFENLGAFTNAYTTKENICFYVNALKGNFSKVTDILTEITFNPTFKTEEIDKERNVIIEEIHSYEDDLEELIYDEADKILYDGHNLAHQITGTVETVKKIDEHVLRKFHNKFFTPSNTTISMAGNISHEKTVKKLEKIFEKLNFNDSIIEKRLVPNDLPRTKLILERSSGQAHLLLTKFIKNNDIRTRYIIAIINIILGDGMSSRLYQSLREKSGIAYSVYSSIVNFEDNTNINIYTSIDRKKINTAKNYIDRELKKLYKNYIKISEFNRAKNQLKSSSVIEMENMSSRMQFLAKQDIFFNNHESLEKSIELIDSIEIGEVIKMIEEEFAPERWHEIRIIPKD